MESLLKEALKCLCGENRWSYAIYWKIGCQNPTLLVWEDYHYEPSRNTTAIASMGGVDGTDMLIKEWEGLWNFHENRFSQVGVQGEDRVNSLLNKMMINNHVHVVGEGVVGRAAFTDFHVWILQENIIREQYPSEILTEVLQQFSAGMQTVAAIPVLPHGVIQLGSTLTIVENMEFINDVKNLFAQLGAAPAALSSDYHRREDQQQKMATPPLFGVPISADSARNSLSQVMKFAPFVSTNRDQEMTTSQASGFAAQPSYPVLSQNQAYTQSNAPALRTSGLSSVMSKSATDLYQVQSRPVIKSHLPLNGQRGTRTVGAQVIFSSSDVRQNQRDSLYQSSSRSDEKHAQSGPSLNCLTFMEQQIASGLGFQEPVNGGSPALNNTNTTQLRSHGGNIPNAVSDSVIVSLLSGSQLPHARNDLQMLTSIPNTASCSSSPFAEVLKFNSSDKNVDHTSNQGNHTIQRVSHQRNVSSGDNITSSKLSKGKQLAESDLYQVFNNPMDQCGAHTPRSAPMPDNVHECSVSSSRHEKESPKFQNVISDNAGAQLPSGDDLFDILGLDFKSKHLYESWNSFLTYGDGPSSDNPGMDATACITQTEASHDVDVGISESGVLNGTGSDHLLDAIISSVHSGAKQNSDDDMSCWTTVTKMSNSSVPTESLKSDHANAQDKKQVKKFTFPSPLTKSQLTGSSSLRTGCSLDMAGESSQINSMYGSQISLLCEDGSTTKRDTSISTAHSKRPDESGKLNRKRLRPGENPRPRPKDRQMIQDRVKELREIVPNGAKCSIDALLERTIKHMLFLQSVTKHAEKLKHTGESKIISKDGGLLLEDNFDRGGATWAFEVGSQSMVCPIIVEDLSTPRQMLVEMLCEEQGFFLEIADIIRGLGLTILKGVMEARNDKVWVRFTVEANRDVTRMEIFLSLVHLLEQAMKSSASSAKNPENSNMMMTQNTFHPAAIPVTGLSTSLQ